MPPRSARRRARELALQGLYAWLVGGSESLQDAGEIEAHLRDEDEFDQADVVWFQTLLHGAMREAPALREKFAPFVDRPLAELSPIEHGILLIGSFELVQPAKGVGDGYRQGAGGDLGAAGGHQLPKHGVIDMPTNVVDQGLANAVGGIADFGEQIFGTQGLQRAVVVQCVVCIGDVCGVMLAVVNRHGRCIDMRLERCNIICQCGQCKRHGSLLKEQKKPTTSIAFTANHCQNH